MEGVEWRMQDHELYFEQEEEVVVPEGEEEEVANSVSGGPGLRNEHCYLAY
jgi:hypothetical protein